MFDTAVTMAEFSAWANDKLYAACAQLSSSDFVAQRGAFFGSIVGTLNHILLVNILYRQRLENGGRSHLKRLDDTLHTDLDELRAAQRAEDEWYIARLKETPDEELDESSVGFYTLLDQPEYWEVS